MKNRGIGMSVCVEELSADTRFMTHAGVFHADDVLGTAILEKAFGTVKVSRVVEVPNTLPDNAIVYDIGNGRFDHHQPGGNGRRQNGVSYASAGLLWREFGIEIVEACENPDFCWRYVDESLVQGVDAADNGEIEADVGLNRAYSFSKMIADFNPEWDSLKTFDEAFIEAVAFSRTILENVISRGNALSKSRSIVEGAISSSRSGIMLLDAPVPWIDALLSSENPKAKDILFVVQPSNRGGYTWRGVPEELGSYKQRLSAPQEWWGLSGRPLQDITGVLDATFCHRTGFAGGSQSLEGALSLARQAIEISGI